ncbi:MAG: hypothetical protein FWG65_10955 [Turicibacter sp.]|nr:hypothetical protein [Turicibacter sp.]
MVLLTKAGRGDIKRYYGGWHEVFNIWIRWALPSAALNGRFACSNKLLYF